MDFDPNDSGLHHSYPNQPRWLQNAQTAPVPGSVPPPFSSRVPTLSSTAAAAAAVHTGLASGYRRVPVPPLRYVPSNIGSAYGASFNNYPYNRSYMNGLANGYGSSYNSYGSSYNSYGQSGQYENPVIAAAAENSRPAFESIQAVVQSFNAVSMMLESTFAAMHMSFQALLGVAENFTRLRMFMMKLYSTMVSFRLARWFLTKLFYLLNMVRGHSGSNAEEDLWTALSSKTQGEFVTPTDGRSWPLVVFTGLLVATPYFVYKLLNSVTPVPNSLRENIRTTPSPIINAQQHTSSRFVVSKMDWNSQSPRTLSLKKGKYYSTSKEGLSAVNQNGGWLYVSDRQGRSGYAPYSIFGRPVSFNQTSILDPAVSELPGMATEIRAPTIPEHSQPLQTMPIVDVDNNPLVLPVNGEKLKEDV